ncbi:tetratricopeptide repeat protein [uncultured Bacteroides sp.]|uniref:tetratricopeptide repeat protein n=1 Tax=uncultured Bacteroides sp. TaxID=162156 RepID=UPI00261C090C|nr:tetratricopeptide repeat protein [uncultured Bacteroides sp.]
MKPHPFFFLCLSFALCMFSSCHDASRRYLPLLSTDSLMSLPADSACRVLERLYPLVPDFPERQRRLFVLQQLNAFYRSDQSLSPYHAELDAACQYFLDADDEVHAGLAYLLRARLGVEEAHPMAALPHFRQAIRLLEHSEKGIYLAMAYGDLGDVYMRQDLYKESMEAHQKARSVYLSIHDIRGELIELNMIAYLYLFEGRCEEALRLYDERLGEMEAGTDTLLWVSLLNNAGVAEQECGHYQEALAKHKLAAFLSCLAGQSPNYQALGEVFYGLGKKDSAFYYLDKAAISGSLETKATACSLLSALHEESGCPEKALHYASLSSQYKDSIFQQTHSLEAMRISYKHRLDEALQQNEASHSIRMFMSVLASVLVIGCLVVLLYRKSKTGKQRLQEYQQKNVWSGKTYSQIGRGSRFTSEGFGTAERTETARYKGRGCSFPF